MKTNIFKFVVNYFKKFFAKTKKEIAKEIQEQPAIFESPKRLGKGQHFHNNRKRTKGRNVQYVHLTNGKTKLLRLETN